MLPHPALRRPTDSYKAEPPHPLGSDASLTFKHFHNTSEKIIPIFSPSFHSFPSEDGGSCSGEKLSYFASSYAGAAQECCARVAAIAEECRRANTKFSDPAFDIETDFSVGINNCLFSLQKIVSGHDVEEDENDDGRKAELLALRLGKRFINTIRGFSPSRKPNCGLRKPSQPGSVHRVPWVFKSPRFTIDGFSNSDIKQGKGGDCWWLAALDTIAHRRDIMDRICVARDEGAGVYGFVFYRDGGCISTVIDDNVYLTEGDYSGDTYGSSRKRANRHRTHKQSGSNALFFAKCGNPNETWLPLLEKAYAKAHGDYQALDGGWVGTAIEDLTGGVTSTIACKAVLDKERLWREMLDPGANDGDFVYSLSTGPGKGHHSGLTPSHAYSMLRATEVENGQGGKVRLVQIRDPWGRRSTRYPGLRFGPWLDAYRGWTRSMIGKLRHGCSDNGVFYITYDELLDDFKWIYRTRLFDDRWTKVQRWTSVSVPWLPGYLKKRFMIEVKQEGTVVVVLSQLDRRYYRGLEGDYDFFLNFSLRSLADGREIRQARPADHWNRRSVNCEVFLNVGTYEVIPKIVAERSDRPPAQSIVQLAAKQNAGKLRRIGLQRDLAHAKGGMQDCEIPSESNRDTRVTGPTAMNRQYETIKGSINQVEAALIHPMRAISTNSNGVGTCTYMEEDNGTSSEDSFRSDTSDHVCIRKHPQSGGKQWHAICVVGLCVHSQHSSLELRLKKEK